MAGSFFLIEKFDDNAQKITARGVMEVASDRTLLVVSSLAILFQILTFATVFGFTPVYAQSLHATKLDMGLLTFFSTFPTAVAAWVGGRHLAQSSGIDRLLFSVSCLTGYSA